MHVFKFNNIKDLYEVHLPFYETICDLKYLNILTKKHDISAIDTSDLELFELLNILKDNTNPIEFNGKTISFSDFQKLFKLA